MNREVFFLANKVFKKIVAAFLFQIPKSLLRISNLTVLV